VHFLPKPWFDRPPAAYHRRAAMKKQELSIKKGLADYQLLLSQEKLMRIVSYKDKEMEQLNPAESSKKEAVFDLKGSVHIKYTAPTKPAAEYKQL
jgi:hypothetical protein